MSVKEKESKPLEKLKQFFRGNKGGNINFRSREAFCLTPDIEKDISSDTSTNSRMKAIKELSDTVMANRVEDYVIERLWMLLKDLLNPEVDKEHRHTTLFFFKCLVTGQYDKLGMMRTLFFRIVQTHDVDEDITQRLELFQSLTENGKDILYLEQEFGAFLVAWMPAVCGAGKTADFLSLLVNAVKYNAAYIDEIVIIHLVRNTCYQCCWSNSKDIILTCLQVLDTVVCYSNLPAESLNDLITTLCRKVNVEEYSQSCWKIMRNLLGTHMGHSTLYTMCRILQDPACFNDFTVLRGAVFYINMGLWGTKRVTTLKCTPTSVLPSFLQVMECNHTVVVYEIALSLQRLVNKYGLELQDPAWHLVLSILTKIAQHVNRKDNTRVTPVATILHETLCTIERLIELGQFNGDVREVFRLIELCSNVRPEASVLRLITFLSSSITPARHEWLTKLDSLLDRYLRQEQRTNIRIKALEVLSTVITNNRWLYQDELIERSVLPYLENMDCEPELAVRNVTSQLLVNLCFECDSKKCLDLLSILQKIINRPYDQGQVVVTNESDVLDIKTIITGLTKMLAIKLYQLPSSHAISIYKILINYLDNHYKNVAVMDLTPSIRYSIFECLLKLRANDLGQLGILEPGSSTMKYSCYLLIDGKVPSERERTCGTISPPPPASPIPSPYPTCSVSTLPLVSASKIIVTALKMERDWRVVSLLLQELPNVMQNKSLILNKYGTDAGLLADCLCSMVSDKSLNLPENLRNLPQKMNRTEFQSYVFPVIVSLASYHTHLEPSQQQRCIKCLEFGLASKCASQCVMALTTCTLEMRDAMYKLLPEVLLNLSKISATVVIAIPILEFLSTLTRLPKVFASFVGDQYMSVFAIALPYTNPFKYNHYTVSLAHHVIAVWFLKCRLPFRRDFVKFITTGLKANVIVPFEEGQMIKPDLSLLNEDSTSRKRSSSLTEQSSRRRERPPVPNSRLSELKPPIDESLMNFHVELTETCIDLMARYTFSSCAARPKRSPTVEFLLSGGQSMTWLLGHKLITVSTSGCSQKPLKSNLCDRCWLMCRTERAVTGTAAGTAGVLTQISDTSDDKVSRQNSGEAGGSVDSESKTDTNSTSNDDSTKVVDTNSEAYKLEQLIFKSQGEDNQANKDVCGCWCQGWAEIYIRRPTGNMSWVMKIQNETNFQNTPFDFPLADVTSLFLPPQSISAKTNSEEERGVAHDSELQGIGEHGPESSVPSTVQPNVGILSISTASSTPVNIPCSPGKRSPSRQNSKESVNCEDVAEDEEYDVDTLSNKSRNPVRRSNSSPEMSASWKIQFLKDKQQQQQQQQTANEEELLCKQKYTSKDMRVSCEAIPEEISGSGTTPPNTDFRIAPAPTPPSSPNIDKQKLNQKKLKNSFKFEQKMFLERQFSLCIDVKSTPGELGKSESNRSINSDEGKLDIMTPSVRDRSRTISVMSPVRKTRTDLDHLKKTISPRTKEMPRSGISPSFVFLQLYHSAHFGSTDEKPMLISQNPNIQHTIRALDFIPPFETHKVGVLYVGRGQSNSETEILRNRFGSLRYAEFLHNLGTLINLKEADSQSLFLGGLDKNGDDGKFAYIWQDDVTQVIFHVATLMPNKESDVNCNAKKAHIGNDFVTIVYNESGDDYNIQTVKGQFNYANVIIEPLDSSTNRVTVKARDEVPELLVHSEPKIVSDRNLAIMARQLALHANLASQVSRSIKAKGQDPYASNWLERLRKIKRLRSKVLQESNSHSEQVVDLHTSRMKKMDYMSDFTEYT